MIAIHNSKTGFHPRWVDYCTKNNIQFKIVNAYDNDLIRQLKDTEGFLWHHNQGSPRDLIIAKPILFALEQAGIKVFPDFRTNWHFDDKVGQKYLLEAIGAPLVPTWVFYDKNEALKWSETTTFPKVFKLRGGAGSQNVKLVHSRAEVRKMIRKAFGRGFSNYDKWGSLKERYRKWILGKTTAFELLKGIIRLGYAPPYAKVLGREVGYIYFQDFIPKNDSDTRIIVIDSYAFALKRFVRKNDFRASGSGLFAYAREEFDERCVRIAFELTEKLKAQSVAYDFVFDESNNPLLLEISYGFVKEVYDPCSGYWDRNLNWYVGTFDPYGWMVDLIVKSE